MDILCYDIQDGFTGSGAYVAGYFYPGDLYNTDHSNRSEIFYIDTYPAMGNGTTKDVSQVYSTLAHEFQHMVNYNQKVLVQGNTKGMDTWLNEGLSMAAEQIYDGHGLSDQVDYYNNSTSIQNGHSLLYWDYNGDTLSNYALSYLFVQYVKLQAGQGDRIFKEIIQDRASTYQAIEDIAKKYIDPNITFGKLMTDFRIACLLKQPTGLYGFKGDPFFNSLKDKFYSGQSANLRGGGAVVTVFNSSVGMTVPADKGQDITYNFFDIPGAEQPDPTPPASPIVNLVGDSDTQITGTAEPGTTVFAVVNQAEIGRTSNETGSFTIPIPKQPAGTVIQVYAKDAAGNTSPATSVIVIDETAPLPPIVHDVVDKDTTVTGQAEAGSKVEITANGTLIGSNITGTDGRFVVPIPVQKAGTELVITAIDQAGNRSQPTTTVVKDVTPPSKPVVNDVTDKDTKVTGTAEAGSVVEIKVNGKGIGTAVTGPDGKFTVKLAGALASGTQLSVTATDAAGNISKATTVIVAKTNPSGWVSKDGKWYYYEPTTSELKKGWYKVGGTWYYSDQNGIMQTGWLKQGSTWYYFNSNGAMQTGWEKIGTTWYYFQSSGAMQIGWLKLDKNWYYFNSSGTMVTGWVRISGKRYYFDRNGVLR
ncbi:Ig-like domain-containing protein [Neobacillus fumarioli]|uniref:Ig-like domain-containing protein n=1 Tax=Neobacillus fumarioli TaxID=105229 RepID=UPI000A7467A5|nr:Ig-like domain-containing protein [Neobacillus fumarioli]